MDFRFKIYDFGKFIGVSIMLISFIVLIYLLIIQTPNIFLWEISAAFWFGSSIFWESSCYEKIIK